jgi:class 3 adenylate cyclase/tetratricopeptide (TPR) repeat protein
MTTTLDAVEGDDPRLADALDASRAGHWQQTLRLCFAILDRNPNDVAARNLLGSALHMLRDDQQAEAAFKLLSVLFVDIGGSSRLTTVLGPERWRGHLLAVQAVVARAVARFEGYIHNYEGDAVLASFSFPRAHDDDARRAVLCGMAIVEEAAEISAVIAAECRAVGADDRFSVRIGIDTGRVLVGPSGTMPSVNAADLVGDAVNFAARLQHQATRSGIAISDRTYGLVRGYVRVEDEGPIELRSFEPQRIHHVVGVTTAVDRLEVTAHRTPMVGRSSELNQLSERWSEVVAGGRGVVLLRGDAGVGKSRLAEVLVNLARAANRPVIELRCSALMRASAFGPIGALLHRFLRLEDAPRPLTSELVEQRLRAAVGLAFADWMPNIVARLVGVDDLPTLLPDELRAMTFQVIVELVRAAVATGPVLVLVEDLHEADPSTLALLNMLGAEESIAGQLIVMTSRELVDGLVAPHDTMEVAPLGIAETRELVGGLLVRPNVETVFTLADRCDGVPLFAEELCMRADPEDTSVPETLEAVLSSRIDRLDADALRVAQQMAVVGQDVSGLALGELVDIGPDRLGEAMQHLLAHRIVVTAPVATATTFRFRHALVREVVYDGMLTAARRSSHGRWASTLAALVAAGEPIRPELIAGHYSAAGDGPAALTWWRRAGERAAAAAAHLEAASHFERALAIVRTQELGTARDFQEFELELQLGLSRSAAEGYASPAAFDAFTAAGALTDRLPPLPTLLPAIWGLWSFQLIRGDLRAAEAHVGQCQAFAERGDAGELGLVDAIIGTQRLFEGNFNAAVQSLEAGKRAAGPGALMIPQDPSLASQCQLAIALWHTGRTIAARAELEACLGAADCDESPRADFNRAYVYSYGAWLHELAGTSERSLELALVAGEVATRRHFATWQVAAQLHAACARSSLGSPADAIEAITIGLSYWRDLGGATLLLPYFLARRGWAHLAVGDTEAAMLDASDGLSLSGDTGQRFHDVDLLRLLASVEHARGAPRSHWLTPLGDAAETAARQGAPILAARVVITAHELGGEAVDGSLDIALAALSDLDADDADPTIAMLAARGLTTTQEALP